MNCIYAILKLLRVKNKVTFISRQSNEINIDFRLIIEQLKEEKPDIKIVTLTRTLDKGLWNKAKYFLHMFVQMYHIATSKVVILDTYCILISILKHRKNLKIIQIWHALGSLKKFGYSSLDKEDGRNSELAKEMKMHKNYSYVLTSSKISLPFFREAFNASDEQMKIMSLPRVDFLQLEKYKKEVCDKFYKIYTEVNNKKENILYCPTKRKKEKKIVERIVKVVDFNKYNLIVKLHNGEELVYVNGKVLSNKKAFTGMELLHVADYIITDYSAIVYEASIVEKPIYFYVYDYEKYMDDRGWYIDYKSEMPGPIKKNIKDIIKLIENKEWNKQRIVDFRNKYIDDLSKNVTEKIVKLVLENM